MNNPSPSRIMLIAGGAVLLIASFLKWRDFFGGSSEGGLSTDITGLQGIFCLLIGGAIAVLVALQTFGNISLPARILGFTWNQLYLMFGLAAFLMTFALQFSEQAAFGITLAWIASAVIVAGAFMELQGEGKSASSAPPKPF